VPTASTAHEQVATVAFSGSGGVWGAAWAGSAAVLAAAGELVRLAVATTGGEDGWRLQGEGVALHIDPASEAGGAGALRAQRCRVSGESRRPGWPSRFEATGLRAWRTLPDPGEARSLRNVLAWFDDGAAVALDAARPARARGHDRDLVNVVLLESAGPVAVEEGRLSLTFRGGRAPVGSPPEPAAGGLSEASDERLPQPQGSASLPGAPARVGLELWLADEEEHYPRRLAAEVQDSPGVVALDGLELWLGRLAAHHAGQDGAGALIVAGRR